MVDSADSVIQQGYKYLVLDFQGVSYLSSAGVVALQTILGKVSGQGGLFALAGAPQEVIRTLELVGALEWLNLYPDAAGTQASFGEARTKAVSICHRVTEIYCSVFLPVTAVKDLIIDVLHRPEGLGMVPA